MDFSSSVSDAVRLLSALDLDLSPASLFKYFVLTVLLVALLWVLGDVYRGEIQNRNIAIDVVPNTLPGYGPADVLFTKKTLDTRAERLPADIILEHRFLIAHGDLAFSRTVRVVRRPARLCMRAVANKQLGTGQFAFDESVEKEIKNRAEYLKREALRRYRNGPLNSLRRLFRSKNWVEPTATGANYLARVRFPSNPYFLLFQHPDREVKATGWLTLLTSLFALFAQFLFSQPSEKPLASPEREIAVVHASAATLTTQNRAH